MNIVMKRLDELKPYENNPRKNEAAVAKVAESIRQFGFKVPIIISADGTIVTGHTRFKAAAELGLSEVPCITADDLTDEQIKAFRLADNKVGEFSSWDFSLLTQELEELADFNMSDFGFDDVPDISDEAFDSFFEDTEPTEKEPKKIQCPHCGEWFEV